MENKIVKVFLSEYQILTLLRSEVFNFGNDFGYSLSLDAEALQKVGFQYSYRKFLASKLTWIFATE